MSKITLKNQATSPGAPSVGETSIYTKSYGLYTLDENNVERLTTNPQSVTQAEAEAGAEEALRSWSPERVKQAIDALASIVSHSNIHKHGGGDEVATATPVANAIPKAGSGGTLAEGWIPPTIKRIGFSYVANPITLTATWQRVACYIWQGTTFYGKSPTSIEVAAVRLSGSVTYDLRIQDITNGLTIATLSGLSNTVFVIHNLGTLSNIPAGQALFELQSQRAAGAATIEVCAQEITF